MKAVCIKDLHFSNTYPCARRLNIYEFEKKVKLYKSKLGCSGLLEIDAYHYITKKEFKEHFRIIPE